MAVSFPISISEKINSPELLAFLQQFGDEFYLTAEEINIIVEAINYLASNPGGPGSLQNLQQVLEQGSQALLNLSNGTTFEANLPYDDTIDQSVMLRLSQGDDYTSALFLAIGAAILNSQGINNGRAFDFQRQASNIQTTPGYYNLLENIFTRNVTTNVEGRLSLQIPTPNEGTDVQIRFPYSAVSAILELASTAYVTNVINQLINGAPEDGNTLKELNDKIVALQSIVGGTVPDGDSIVNTLNELLAVFQSYTEGVDLAVLLNGKVNTDDVVNNLTQLLPGKILDARQGPVIAALIAAKWTAVDATALVKGIMKLYNAAGNNTDGGVDQNFFTQTTLAKRGIENANYAILATDKIVTTAAALTANRTFTLAGDAPAGKEVIITDEFGAVGTYTLTIQAPSGKKLNGVINGTEVIQSAYGWRRLITDGNGNWNFDAGIVRQQQLTSALAGKQDALGYLPFSDLHIRKGSYIIFDEFFTTSLNTVPFAKLTVTSGSFSLVDGGVTNPGIVRINSSTNNSSGGAIFLVNSATATPVSNIGSQFDVIVRLPNSILTRGLYFGLVVQNTNGNEPTEGAYFVVTNTSVLCKTAASSVRTSSSSYSLDNNFNHFRIKWISSSLIEFYIYSMNGTLLFSTTITTNISTSSIQPMLTAIRGTGTTVDAIADIDYIGYTFPPLVRGVLT